MLKYKERDFGYDQKSYKKYLQKKKRNLELRKLNRLKQKAYLYKLCRNNDYEEYLSLELR